MLKQLLWREIPSTGGTYAKRTCWSALFDIKIWNTRSVIVFRRRWRIKCTSPDWCGTVRWKCTIASYLTAQKPQSMSDSRTFFR